MPNHYLANIKKTIFCTWQLLCHLVFLSLALGIKALWLKDKAIVDTDHTYLLDHALNLTIVLLSIVIIVTIFEDTKQQNLKFLGLKVNSKTLPDLLFGFLLSGGLIAFLYSVGIAFNLIHIERFIWEAVSIFDVVKRCSIWFLIFTLVAAWEELVARGYWLHTIEKNFNVSLGIIISSVLFTVFHLLLGNATWRVGVTFFY